MHYKSRPAHIKWLSQAGPPKSTENGDLVYVWDLKHENCEATLSAWARHFRNHYCLDSDLDFFVDGTGLSKTDYLLTIKFPDITAPPGPSVRAGDFGEILVADFLEFRKGYWVPRTRYSRRTVRNDSTKGSDVIGFLLADSSKYSDADQLVICEVKAKLTGKSKENILQDAVNHSTKDNLRKAESLNAIKQNLRDKGDIAGVNIVSRFQSEVDHPYTQLIGAVAVLEESNFSADVIYLTNTKNHPLSDRLNLMVICGSDLMDLVHSLYERAANEA